MRIGLISDTHIPQDSNVIPIRVKEAFSNVDLILHAGDIYTTSVLDELERLAPVLAAAGDDDYSDVRSDQRVKERHILTVGGVTIWLTHLMSRSWLQHEKAPDVIVLGHSHCASIEHLDGTLVINPGSATLPYDTDIGTVAVLGINSGKTEVNIVHLW